MEGNLAEWILRLVVTIVTCITVIIGWNKGRQIHYKRKGHDRRNDRSGTMHLNPGVTKADLKTITDACEKHLKETKDNHDEIIRIQGRLTNVESKLIRTCTENKTYHTWLFTKIEELLVKVGR